MKAIKFIFQLLFALAVLGGIALGVGLLGLRVIHAFLALPQAIAVAFVAAIVAPIGSVASLAAGKYLEKKRAIEQDIRAKKSVAYEALLETWFGLMLSKGHAFRDDKGELTDEAADRVREVNKSLIIWGSTDVLKKWSRLRRRLGKHKDPVAFVAEMEMLLRAIRSDVGHSNRGLGPGDAVGVFINDLPVPDEEPSPRESAETSALRSRIAMQQVSAQDAQPDRTAEAEAEMDADAQEMAAGADEGHGRTGRQ